MSRSSYLTMDFDYVKVENGAKVVIDLLKKINEEHSKMNKMSVSMDTASLKNATKDLEILKKAYTDFSKTQKGVEIPKPTEKDDWTRYAKGILSVGVAFTTVSKAFSSIKSLSTLESSVANLAIASSKSMGDMNAIYKDFFDMSNKIPIQANNLIKVADTLVRTGKSYKESLEITKETAKLSVATGEDLESTASTVAKLMTALQINSGNTEKVLNTLHSTAIQTASSMESISGGFKQVAGVLGALSVSSGKSGEDLENYKQKLLEVGAAGLGVMNNLGKSASESGTKIKVIFTKLVNMEKTAKNLFNRDTKDYELEDKYKNILQTNDSTLNAQVLSNLARKDLPAAIELMSKLKIQGVIAGETIQKIFTQRHSLDTEVYLNTVNGNIENLTNTITKGMNYLKDYEVQMFTLANNWEKFSNKMKEGTMGGASLVTSVITSVLYSANTLMEQQGAIGKFAKSIFTIGMGIGDLALKVGTVGLSFQLLGKSLGLAEISIKEFTKVAITGISSIASIFTTKLGLIGLAIGALSMAFTHFKKQQMESQQEVNNFAKAVGESDSELKKIETQIQSINLSMSRFSEEGLAKFGGAESLKLIMGVGEEFDKVKTIIESINSIDFSELKTSLSKLGNLKEEKDQLEKDIKDISDKVFKSFLLRDSIKQKMNPSSKVGLSDDYLKAMLNGNSVDMDKISERYEKKYKEKLDVGSAYTNMLGFSGLSRNAEIETQLKLIEEKREKIKEIEESVGKTDEAVKKINTSLENLNNQSLNKINTNIKELSKKGFFYDEQQNLKEMKKHYKEYIELMEKNYKESNKPFIEKATEAREELVKIGEEYEKIKNDNTLTDTQKKELIDKKGLKDTLEDIKNIDTLLGQLKMSLVDLTTKVYKIPISVENVNSLQDIFDIQLEANMRGFTAIDLSTKKYNASQDMKGDVYASNLDQLILTRHQEIKTALDSDIQAAGGGGGKGSKSTPTKYKIEYIKLLDRELELEKTIALIGKQGLERDIIETEYSKKNINREIEELSLAKQRNELELKKFNIYKSQGESEEAFLSRLSKQKEYLESLGEVSGDIGEKKKNEHNAIVQMYNSIIELKNKENQLQIENISLIEKAHEKMLESKYLIGETLTELSDAFRELGIGTKGINQLENLRGNVFNSKLIDSLDKIIKNGYTENTRKIYDFAVTAKDKVTSGGKVDSKEVLDTLFGEDNEFRNRFKTISQAYEDIQSKQKTMSEQEFKQYKTKFKVLGQEIKTIEDLTEVLKELTKEEEYQLEKKRKELERHAEIGSGGLAMVGGWATLLPGKAGKSLSNGLNGLSTFVKGISEQGFQNLWSSKNSKGDTSWYDEKGGFDHSFQSYGDKLEELIGANTYGGQLGAGISGFFDGANQQFVQQWSGLAAAGTYAGMKLLASSAAAGPAAIAAAAVVALATSFLSGRNSKKIRAAQERAAEKTQQATNEYKENVEAINRMVQSLDALNNNIIGFNKAMIDTFSKIPTIDNIARIEKGYRHIYTSINNARDFGHAGYLSEHSKRVGSKWGGGKATVTWLEYNKRTTDSLLREFGFGGGIKDMSTPQMLEFSAWLKKKSSGKDNNFKEFALIFENYVTVINSLERVTRDFGKKATMQGFEGINVQKQEDVVKQITDMYKQAGIVITDDVQRHIDNIAKEMSVLVVIMDGVRSNFLKEWKETGGESGKVFSSSMKPYMDAMLNNMSQVFFDTTFSSLVKRLDDQFQGITDKLYQLKQLGTNLTWRQIFNAMKEPFDNVLTLMKEGKNNTDLFNTALLQLQKTALDKGFGVSELKQLGLMTTVQSNIYDTFKSGLQSQDMNGALKSVGDLIGGTVAESLSQKLIDQFLGQKLLTLSSKVEETLSNGTSLKSMSELSQVALSTGLQLESERLKLTAIRDMFDFNKDINYQNQNNDIKYETGTSQTIVNNFYLTGAVNAGVVIPQDSVQGFVDETLNTLIEALKVQKGIDLTKI